MSDPKDQKYEREPPTLALESVRLRHAAGAATATPTPPPVSPKQSASFSEAPTLLGTSYPTLAPTAQGSAPDAPAGKTWSGVVLGPGTILANRYEILEILGEG